MKKTTILSILLLFVNCLFGQDKNQAINDYLQTIISDYNQELIIKKEKISNNIALNLFQGGLYLDSITNTLKREGGAPDSLYNKKDYSLMEKKYYDKMNVKKEYFSKTAYWVANNFKYKNIKIVPFKDYLDLTITCRSEHLPKVLVFSFSEPLFYKCKKYIIITISKGNSNGFMNFEEFLLIMKKENKKWVIANKIYCTNCFE